MGSGSNTFSGSSAEYAPRSFDELQKKGASSKAFDESGTAGSGAEMRDSDGKLVSVRHSGSFQGGATYRDAVSTRLGGSPSLPSSVSHEVTSSSTRKRAPPLSARLEKPIHMFAILDGHGGKTASQYCATKLVEVLQQKLRKHKRWASALPEAFQETGKFMHYQWRIK